MSASVRSAGSRIARQFALAVILCTGVAGGAAVTALLGEDPVSRQVVVDRADNNWPAVPTGAEDNNWPVVPTGAEDNNWPVVPTGAEDNNWPTPSLAV